jgi:cysteine desulfuration protein SufE
VFAPGLERGAVASRQRCDFGANGGNIDLGGAALYIRDDVGSRTMAEIDDIIDNFSVLDDWDDRYRYLIELGRGLAPLPEALRTEANKVRGCASQVWLASATAAGAPRVLELRGDSDAHIVRGLIAVLFALFDDKTAEEILATDAGAVFAGLGLKEHLTPQRSNGFFSMVERIRADAQALAAATA